MTKILALSLFLLILLPLPVFGVEIIGPETFLTEDIVLASTGIVLDEKNLNDLKSGIGKELTFHIDLYRIWKNWPDEFVAGKKIVKTIVADPVKREFVASSFDGSTLVKRRFKDLESMLAWSSQIKDIELIHVRELEPADYFVKVTVESRLRKLPPVIGYILFFVPEKEFRVTKQSLAFVVGNTR